METTALELCNKLTIEAEHIADTGFPLDVFPQKVQALVFDMLKRDNFKVEYTATAMLSAVSAALGDTYRIHVKSEWETNAALYIILVGRPGLGKTPPLEAAYRPVRRHDYEQHKKFKAAWEAYKAAGKESGQEEPVLSRTILSDFTPEVLMQVHNNNPRSVVILVDEIMGMFNSANRYSNGPLIEQLLTAWSGSPLDVTRVVNPVPIHIENPCINIIGTTQTKRIRELLKKGYEENGLLDRILFVLPRSQKIARWVIEDDEQPQEKTNGAKWAAILDKVFALDYQTDEQSGEKSPHLLRFDQEAKVCLYNWQNSIIDALNETDSETEGESHRMKHNTHVVRLALLLQVLRYASGEGHLQYVDVQSVKGAIRLNDYFEDSLQRIREAMANDICDEPAKELLSLLGDTFGTAEAIEAGRQMRVSERSVMNYLKELMKHRLVRKVRQGQYEKISYRSNTPVL